MYLINTVRLGLQHKLCLGVPFQTLVKVFTETGFGVPNRKFGQSNADDLSTTHHFFSVLDCVNGFHSIKLSTMPPTHSFNTSKNISYFFLSDNVLEMSSFSFLSDAFPNYTGHRADRTELFENFTAAPKTTNEDNDLLMKDVDQRTPKTSTPEAFDASSDYFKILASKWEPTPPSPKKPSSSHQGCMSVAEHLDQCSDCRARLEQIFRRLLDKPIVPIVPIAPVATVPTVPTVLTPPTHSVQSTQSVYLEITLLVLLGIFIVFVLDAFVRLGKYFKTR